ncbi:hypothetical protein ACH4T9_31365 [Micromonospora sp. NPDC020750]|uniref:hypothetical protein n=1 Tax=unclassified Micromonospora TaxID=2617518 RepID=UPI0037BCFD8F
MTTYPELIALRRPPADHSGLPTAILPTAIRPAPAPEPASAVRPAGYVGQHRQGGAR